MDGRRNRAYFQWALKIKFFDESWTPEKAATKFIYNFFIPRTNDACLYTCGTISGLYIKDQPSIDII